MTISTFGSTLENPTTVHELQYIEGVSDPQRSEIEL